MPQALLLEIIRRPEPAAALLDPTRQKLLAHLAEPDSAAGLARRLRLPRQRINYHLRVLEETGLVEPVEERRKGNCLERVVRATARAFVISPEALGARARKEGKRIATLTLEAELRFASAESRAAFADELAEAMARLTAKYHDERAPEGRRFRLLAAVYPMSTKGGSHGKDAD